MPPLSDQSSEQGGGKMPPMSDKLANPANALEVYARLMYDDIGRAIDMLSAKIAEVTRMSAHTFEGAAKAVEEAKKIELQLTEQLRIRASAIANDELKRLRLEIQKEVELQKVEMVKTIQGALETYGFKRNDHEFNRALMTAARRSQDSMQNLDAMDWGIDPNGRGQGDQRKSAKTTVATTRSKNPNSSGSQARTPLTTRHTSIQVRITTWQAKLQAWWRNMQERAQTLLKKK